MASHAPQPRNQQSPKGKHTEPYFIGKKTARCQLTAEQKAKYAQEDILHALKEAKYLPHMRGFHLSAENRYIEVSFDTTDNMRHLVNNGLRLRTKNATLQFTEDALPTITATIIDVPVEMQPQEMLQTMEKYGTIVDHFVVRTKYDGTQLDGGKRGFKFTTIHTPIPRYLSFQGRKCRVKYDGQTEQLAKTQTRTNQRNSYADALHQTDNLHKLNKYNQDTGKYDKVIQGRHEKDKNDPQDNTTQNDQKQDGKQEQDTKRDEKQDRKQDEKPNMTKPDNSNKRPKDTDPPDPKKIKQDEPELTIYNKDLPSQDLKDMRKALKEKQQQDEQENEDDKFLQEVKNMGQQIAGQHNLTANNVGNAIPADWDTRMTQHELTNEQIDFKKQEIFADDDGDIDMDGTPEKRKRDRPQTEDDEEPNPTHNNTHDKTSDKNNTEEESEVINVEDDTDNSTITESTTHALSATPLTYISPTDIEHMNQSIIVPDDNNGESTSTQAPGTISDVFKKTVEQDLYDYCGRPNIKKKTRKSKFTDSCLFEFLDEKITCDSNIESNLIKWLSALNKNCTPTVLMRTCARYIVSRSDDLEDIVPHTSPELQTELHDHEARSSVLSDACLEFFCGCIDILRKNGANI